MIQSIQQRGWSLCVALAICSAVGCAAFTNPVVNGIPVRILPEELLAESREGFVPLPLSLLRQAPPKQYILAPGDTLGIYIEGVLGDAETPPPVNIPDSSDIPPSIGYPFPVRQDGTISLPYVEPIKVAGLTIEEAEQTVVRAYLKEKIIRPEDRRILVTLMRPRHIRVMVIRDDSSSRQVMLRSQSLRGLGTTQTQIGGGQQNTGMVLELPAYENDVLNALTLSGGLPGLESTQEVIIQRGYWNQQNNPNGMQSCYPVEADLDNGPDGERRVIHIPMRIRGSEPINFTSQDIILQTGDIVIVRAQLPEFYYTGGLLPANEVAMANDYDLSVVEAVLKGQGPLVNGGLNSSNLSGNLVGPGLGNPSPSLLSVVRKTSQGGQIIIRVDLNEAMRDPRENILVQANDILILQETPEEAMTRYFTQTFQTNLFFRWLDRADAQGTGSLVAP